MDIADLVLLIKQEESSLMSIKTEMFSLPFDHGLMYNAADFKRVLEKLMDKVHQHEKRIIDKKRRIDGLHKYRQELEDKLEGDAKRHFQEVASDLETNKKSKLGK